jgi:hypothetical protein
MQATHHAPPPHRLKQNLIFRYEYEEYAWRASAIIWARVDTWVDISTSSSNLARLLRKDLIHTGDTPPLTLTTQQCRLF